MGILDAKERVLDVVLTDLGRELLSKNLLDFEFYVFSDQGVDYAAAFTASLLQSGSVENYMRRTLLFEGVQNKDGKERTDLQTFLYSIPPRRVTLPEFSTNFDDTPNLTAKRRFYIDRLIATATTTTTTQAPIAVVAQGTLSQNSVEQAMNDYVAQQQYAQTQNQLAAGQNVVGMQLGLNLIALNSQTALNTDSGLTTPMTEASAPTPISQTSVDVVSLEDDVEVVSGLDRLKINFSLKSSEGSVEALSGYLVEVFESGSDGSIVKLFEESVVDVLEGEVLKKGFENDLFFDGDAENANLISEGERLRKKELRKREQELERLQKRLREKLNESSGNS